MPHVSVETRDLFEEWADLGGPRWWLPEGEHLVTLTAQDVCGLVSRVAVAT